MKFETTTLFKKIIKDSSNSVYLVLKRFKMFKNFMIK
jgi:hypothetical protein